MAPVVVQKRTLVAQPMDYVAIRMGNVVVLILTVELAGKSSFELS